MLRDWEFGLDKLVQKQLIQRLDDAMSKDAEQFTGQTHRLSAKRYTCADEYLREQQTLFSRYPVIVGHQSQLPNVGDYLTTELAGVHWSLFARKSTRSPSSSMHAGIAALNC